MRAVPICLSVIYCAALYSAPAWGEEYSLLSPIADTSSPKVNVFESIFINNKTHSVSICTVIFIVSTREFGEHSCQAAQYNTVLNPTSTASVESYPSILPPRGSGEWSAIWQIDQTAGALQFCLLAGGPSTNCVLVSPP
jgi:hypothetical protein